MGTCILKMATLYTDTYRYIIYIYLFIYIKYIILFYGKNKMSIKYYIRLICYILNLKLSN